MTELLTVKVILNLPPPFFTKEQVYGGLGLREYRHKNKVDGVLFTLREHRTIRYFQNERLYTVNTDYMRNHLSIFINQNQLSLNQYFNKNVFNRTTEIPARAETTEIPAGAKPDKLTN
jgi:hypothetical protein